LPDLLPPQTEEAAKRIDKVYKRFRLASVSLVAKQAEYDKRLAQDKKEYKTFQDAQWAQYEAFIEQRTAPFAGQVQALAARMQALLTARGAADPDQLATDYRREYYRMNIERAKAELRRAQAEAEARDYGLHHLTSFQQQAPEQAYLARSQELEKLRQTVEAELEATDKLHVELYDAFTAYRAAVGAQLGYWDFVYFSVGAATTATFGDIAPNSTQVRMLVCLQVLGSIIFTGLMINDWASKRLKPGP